LKLPEEVSIQKLYLKFAVSSVTSDPV
jgi:hypothetical protein